jgi:hypothetical protein
VVNPTLWSYDPAGVAALQDRQRLEGNSDGGGLFGAENGTRYPAVREPWLWNVNPFIPPPPPRPPRPPPRPPPSPP